jgi:hypothetical protein
MIMIVFLTVILICDNNNNTYSPRLGLKAPAWR